MGSPRKFETIRSLQVRHEISRRQRELAAIEQEIEEFSEECRLVRYLLSRPTLFQRAALRFGAVAA